MDEFVIHTVTGDVMPGGSGEFRQDRLRLNLIDKVVSLGINSSFFPVPTSGADSFDDCRELVIIRTQGWITRLVMSLRVMHALKVTPSKTPTAH